MNILYKVQMKFYYLLILGITFFLGCKTTVIEEKHEGVSVQKVSNTEVKLIAKDSTKDISLLLNRLIDNAKIKKITFGDGTFNIAHTIFVQRSNITFQGSQRSVLKATVKQKEKFNLFFVNEDLRLGGYLCNVHYKNLIIDGNNFGFLGLLQFNRVENFSVKNCEFHNGGKTTKDNKNLPSEWTDGIACSNKSQGKIIGNKVIGMSKVGIYVAPGCNTVEVSGNIVDMRNLGVNRTGIQCLINGIIKDNVIKNCTGAGILGQTIEPTDNLINLGIDVRPYNIRINNNKIENCQIGIEFNHSVLYDDRIKNIQKLNPRLSVSSINDNTILNSSFCGISITNRDSIDIGRNNIYNDENIKLGTGIQILGSNYITVKNNVIENASQNIFFINNSKNILIENNSQRNSKIVSKYEIELRTEDNNIKNINYRKNVFKSMKFSNIDLIDKIINIDK
ncbi:MAG TPA: right-handed parallel beta-helix repeat-containing protein [Saprospiraceae bacterium]|nr:right-handed parallel beta-helix repeat-containing protein [Saprospiraceae bacterium]MCO6500228.1 right-handed parallel beta-helix repeat-containing protein [Vicingus serpentipes]HCN38335.1 hypothetical protein [Bacteroidota bacterium]HRN33719.1 right-handed parallel beta-helix repeat-containing protein [Saprospiraceae bacterium]HRP83994.1 right-handed parallel beta-helix repeat-containing protein [Saprospiraceae bacterium]